MVWRAVCANQGDIPLNMWGPGLQNYNILEQRHFNVIILPCIDKMSIVQDHWWKCRALNVYPEYGPGNLEPASMSLGCAASLPKPLFIQKTILGTDMSELVPGDEMIRNKWMGVSAWGSGLVN